MSDKVYKDICGGNDFFHKRIKDFRRERHSTNGICQRIHYVLLLSNHRIQTLIPLNSKFHISICPVMKSGKGVALRGLGGLFQHAILARRFSMRLSKEESTVAIFCCVDKDGILNSKAFIPS